MHTIEICSGHSLLPAGHLSTPTAARVALLHNIAHGTNPTAPTSAFSFDNRDIHLPMGHTSFGRRWVTTGTLASANPTRQRKAAVLTNPGNLIRMLFSACERRSWSLQSSFSKDKALRSAFAHCAKVSGWFRAAACLLRSAISTERLCWSATVSGICNRVRERLSDSQAGDR